jgi:ParB-like chromosome segregation protein Spo0J
MNIEQVPIYDIKPYENNAKKHTDAQIEEIAKSIHDFGFNQNLVIDKNNCTGELIATLFKRVRANIDGRLNA